ncbi:retropepsin-like aspartic protease family protein [Phreatobacter stygius]|uniref:TIGR02281 family clan AA aspartic protease n=1 Tax=Phreatobacter stygius TaxID=1940610 RepID=A0A4D7AYV3_9HYPH|nr:TIGR02281 family clan AA aspartic protease [Phreatobacter stygius]QCI66519.1 TIGR02281 family clan AA aspartic protease [Phreatobacter stygius]
MLPKAFYLLMLPAGLVAIVKPEVYTVLLALALPQQATVATTPVPAAAPPPAVATPFGPRRLIADRDGHFRARARAGGRSFDAMVDTGATIVVLTWQTGLDLNLVRPGETMDAAMQTANGRVLGKRVTIPRLEVEGLSVSSVPAVVLPQGALAINLLGMSYLSRLRRFEFSQNALVLEQ